MHIRPFLTDLYFFPNDNNVLCKICTSPCMYFETWYPLWDSIFVGINERVLNISCIHSFTSYTLKQASYHLVQLLSLKLQGIYMRRQFPFMGFQ